MRDYPKENIWAITPLDGRYFEKVRELQAYVSEGGLNAYRIQVELAWFFFLVDKLHLAAEEKKFFSLLKEKLTKYTPTDSDLNRVKTIEGETNHDVKAIEYFLRELLVKEKVPEKYLGYIHFACTSEDTNNTAYGLMLGAVRENIFCPLYQNVLKILQHLSLQHADQPMPAKTHGQLASPTTFGKEVGVFYWRLKRVWKNFAGLEILAKFNGAVGNYHAHNAAYPEKDWVSLSQEFVEEKLGLRFNPMTTQIESHDNLSEYCFYLLQSNAILLDLCRDFWGYISFGYLKQNQKDKEIGSSTMPHKVNPIDFENAEGNFGLSTCLLQHLQTKLPVSRFQRDLSDSTVMRSLGVAFGYQVLGLKSLLQGLGKITVDTTLMEDSLVGEWQLLSEPLQTLLRKYGVKDAYEQVKGLNFQERDLQVRFQEILDRYPQISQEDRKRFLSMVPQDYVGIAPDLVRRFCLAF